MRDKRERMGEVRKRGDGGGKKGRETVLVMYNQNTSMIFSSGLFIYLYTFAHQII